ncbi:MAG: hypothetical protein GMKNLPBB_02491 [Myxococcota bacterium]|nr:hypothetical protein [Myxococcota bacterium]
MRVTRARPTNKSPVCEAHSTSGATGKRCQTAAKNNKTRARRDWGSESRRGIGAGGASNEKKTKSHQVLARRKPMPLNRRSGEKL